MILAVDANNLVSILWHAQENKTLDFATMAVERIEAYANWIKASELYIAFDRRSFRHYLFPGYKAHRPIADPRKVEALIETELAAARIGAVIAETGFEADDMLASVASRSPQGQKVVLMSSDKDLRQCLRPGEVVCATKIIVHRNGECDVAYYSTSMLKAAYGLCPYQWTSYQALVGDSSDGIPGCEGWGEKTAIAALADGRMLDDVVQDHSHVKLNKKQKASIATFDKDLMLRLVTLRTDSKVVDQLMLLPA